MNELLGKQGMVEVAEDTIFVTGMKGPLRDGWQTEVAGFVNRVLDPDIGLDVSATGDS